MPKQPLQRKKTQLKVDLLSLFPKYFNSPFEQSLLKRAIAHQILDINLVDIRDFADPPHYQVDDTSYGGGPGMVLMPEPVNKAIESVKQEDSYVVYLSPQGKKLSPSVCKRLASKPHLIVLCGHYEGIDQRIIENQVDEEISIGDYIISSGCPAALVLIDATARFVPGFVGKAESTEQDSFEATIFDHPHYTKPQEFQGDKVPKVLLDGNHEAIESYRKKRAVEKTREQRDDLFGKWLFDHHNQAQAKASFFVEDLKKANQFYKKIFTTRPVEDGMILEIEEDRFLVQESAQPTTNLSLQVKADESTIQKITTRLRSSGIKSFLHQDADSTIKGCTFEDIHGIMWHLAIKKGVYCEPDR